VAGVIGSLLAALVFAAGAAGEDRALDLISTGPNGGNLDFDVSFLGASTDASRVFFETDESLASADTDSELDIYERAGAFACQRLVFTLTRGRTASSRARIPVRADPGLGAWCAARGFRAC
jgi:hypothetical protein